MESCGEGDVCGCTEEEFTFLWKVFYRANIMPATLRLRTKAKMIVPPRLFRPFCGEGGDFFREAFFFNIETSFLLIHFDLHAARDSAGTLGFNIRWFE